MNIVWCEALPYGTTPYEALYSHKLHQNTDIEEIKAMLGGIDEEIVRGLRGGNNEVEFLFYDNRGTLPRSIWEACARSLFPLSYIHGYKQTARTQPFLWRWHLLGGSADYPAPASASAASLDCS